MAATRSGSVTRSTTCSTPSTVTVPIGSPGWTSSVGETAGQRQPPHRGEVGVRRPGQVEAVGGGLRRRALVGQHTAGALVDDLQAAEHADEVAPGARGVGEPHAVERERRLVVADHRGVGDPRPQQVASQRVAVRPAAGDVDVDDVAGVAGLEGVDVGIRQHVVRRGDDGGEVDGWGVADGTERVEAGHVAILAVPLPTGTVPCSWTPRSIRPSSCAISTASCGWPARRSPDRWTGSPACAAAVDGSCSSPTTPRPSSPTRRRR